MKLDPRKMELHNLIVRDTKLFVRPGLREHLAPTSGTVYVAGFSVESPSTTEVWHYLVEQHIGTRVATLRVYTEEYLEMFSVALGNLGDEPVITYGVQNNQIMINSPSFSSPLYGLVGGGLVQAQKVASRNPDTTALEIPTGHITTWGDRFAIAAGNVVFINDPGTEPRTFVAQNAIAFPGTVYDLFQGPDGGLWVFTSADVYVMSADALGQGQTAVGFITTIPGVHTSGPRNAATSCGAVLALTKDGATFVTTSSQRRIDLAPYEGKRYWSRPVEVDDYRLQGLLFKASDGFALGFHGRRDFWLDINLRSDFRSFAWTRSSALSLVGTLRTRDGETLYVTKTRILAAIGTDDFSEGGPIRGIACGRIDTETDDLVARHITVTTDAVAADALTYMHGSALFEAVPAQPFAADTPGVHDIVIGTSLWSASGPKLFGRDARTVRMSMAERCTDVQIEVGVAGHGVGGARLALCDLEAVQQGPLRKSRSA